MFPRSPDDVTVPWLDETLRAAGIVREARVADAVPTVVGTGQMGTSVRYALGYAGEVAGAPASVGIRVELPFEQDVNPFVEQAFEHETFFTRLHHFVIASDAFVVVPGGIGTVLETLMIWQLLQVRHVDDVPLILVGKMWKGLVEWARGSMLDPRLALANADDLQIPQCVDTADEAIAVVRDLHIRWQASRKT